MNDRRRKHSVAQATIGALAALVLVGVLGWLAVQEPPPPPEPVQLGVEVKTVERSIPKRVDPGPAFAHASRAISDALSQKRHTLQGWAAVARQTGDEATALRIDWLRWSTDRAAVAAVDLARMLEAAGDDERAREVALWAVAAGDDDKLLTELLERSWEREFGQKTKTKTVSEDDFEGLIGVEHRPIWTFTLQGSDGARVRFVPRQRGWSAERAEAAYRLCALMVCHFKVPAPHRARVGRRTLEKWVDALPEAQRPERDLWKDLEFDGRRLPGVIYNVPSGSAFPIENTEIWRQWLRASPVGADLGLPAATTTSSGQWQTEAGPMSTKQLARQIGTMVLVDYLINDWNRFTDAPPRWGSRVSLFGPQLWSARPEMAFDAGSTKPASGRFRWVERFSATSVRSLERLDKKRTERLLFPKPNRRTREAFKEFWGRRAAAIKRIRALTKKHEAEDIFVLD